MLLERKECEKIYEFLMKDICCVLNSLRDKYSICSKLIENIIFIEKSENRIFILLNIFKILLKSSFYTKLKYLLNNLNNNNNDNNNFNNNDNKELNNDKEINNEIINNKINETEIKKFHKEHFLEYFLKNNNNNNNENLKNNNENLNNKENDINNNNNLINNNNKTEFEEILTCEIIFCECKEFLTLKIDKNNKESLISYLQIGIEIIENNIISLYWNNNSNFLITCIIEFCKILTKLFNIINSNNILNNNNENENFNNIKKQLQFILKELNKNFKDIKVNIIIIIIILLINIKNYIIII
jgi:hypothetical protein